MKKITIISILMLFFSQSINAQTPIINQSKYWFYRYRLLTEFLAEGEDACGNPSGLSIPIDNAYGSTGDTYIDPITGKRVAYDAQFSYGDGSSMLGYYIGVLATEFSILERNGAPISTLEKVLDELYYAMKAYERLDKNAEKLIPATQMSNDCNDNLNGFFLRDDAPGSANDLNESLILNNRFKYPMKREISSDYSQNRDKSISALTSASINIGGQKGSNMFNSQDQIADLMVGFSLVVKLMDGWTRNGYNFKDNAKLYTNELFTYLKTYDYTIPVPGHITYPIHDSYETTIDAYAISKAGDMVYNEQMGQAPKFGIFAPTVTFDNTVSVSTKSFWDGLDYPFGKTVFDQNVSVDQNGKSNGNDWNNAIISTWAAIGDSWGIAIDAEKEFDQTLKVFSPICPEQACPPQICLFGGCWQPPCVNYFGPCFINLGHIQVWCYKLPTGYLSNEILYQIEQDLGLGSSNFSTLLINVLNVLNTQLQLDACLPIFNPSNNKGLPGIYYNTTGHSLSKYADDYNLQLFPLLHRVLQDNKGDYVYDESKLPTILNSAPCTGPHYYPYNDPNIASNIDVNAPIYSATAPPVGDEGVYGWRNDNRWEKTIDATHRNNAKASFNGLDYMLFYNLYEIVHGNYGANDNYANQINTTASNQTFPRNRNRKIEGSDLNLKLFYGYESIVSDHITVNAGAVNSNSNGDVVMKAGESIKLTNLKVKTGADFKAYIAPVKPCEAIPTNHRGNDVVQNNPNKKITKTSAALTDEQYQDKIGKVLSENAKAIGASMKNKQQQSYQSVNSYVSGRSGNAEFVETKVWLYPNPVGDLLTVNSFSSNIKEVSISDQLGNEILKQTIAGEQSSIDLSMNSVPSGIYFVKISYGSQVEVKKIVKSN